MRRAYAVAAVLALLLAAGAAYTAHQREVGALRERLRVTDSTAKALTVRARAVDTLYRRDTVRLTRALTRWDTVRAGVDTLRDTVAVPVEVVRWVVAEADSTIRSCRIVVQTCEQRVAVRDSLIVTLRRTVALTKAQQPNAWRVWGERALWAGLVVVAAKR